MPNGVTIHRFGFAFESEAAAKDFCQSCRASLTVILADHFGSVAYVYTRSTIQFQTWLFFEWPEVFALPRTYKGLSWW